MSAKIMGEDHFLEHLQAIRNNSTQALQQLYTNNYPVAERYILQNSGTEEEAKDNFQEAIIAVWRNIKLEKFVPQNEAALKAYLLQVSKYKWISHLRSATFKNTRSMNDETIPDVADDEKPAYEDHFITAVGEALIQLGGRCKDVLTDFYYNKKSMRDIAANLGWTEATARNNKYRCLEKLRNLLKDQNIQSSE